DGNKAGGEHEKTLLKYWSADSDKAIAGNTDIISRAWELMIGRAMPGGSDVENEVVTKEDRGDYIFVKSIVHNSHDKEDVPCAFIGPKPEKWNGTAVLWLSNKGIESLGGEAGPPSAEVKKLIDAGVAIVCPTLYLPDAKEQPMNVPKSKDATRREWQWAACYTYGYNPSLVAHRVHDAMTVLAMIRNHPKHKPTKVLVVGGDGAGVIAAATASVAKSSLDGAVVDTEGFRFASLNDQWNPMFVPGAVKYGDVPGLLSTSASLKTVVLGEKEAKGGADAIAAALGTLAK
ncbi:MAG: hypothetical protein JWO89_1057, partial [Verrucomicrobiaceae bacterium]|nr:hypothetical protein [Verrucomicrobiaceae bacterium]